MRRKNSFQHQLILIVEMAKNCSEVVSILVGGYIDENSLSWVPNEILNLVILFYGVYDTNFDSNIIGQSKMEFMDLICTQLNERIKLERLYSGLTHGFNTKSFHENCDNKGATIVLIKNSNEYIFGGYTSQSWKSQKTLITDRDAFLFQIYPNIKIFEQKEDNNGEYAVHHYCDHSDGTRRSEWVLGFGVGCNFWISNNCNTNHFSGAYNGTIYNYGKSTNLVGGVPQNGHDRGLNFFYVQDMEVFKVIWQ